MMRYREERNARQNLSRFVKQDTFDWDLAYRRAVESLTVSEQPQRR